MAGFEEKRKLSADPNLAVTEKFLTTMTMLPLAPGDSPEALRQRRLSPPTAMNRTRDTG
jgi:hypothetical protein